MQKSLIKQFLTQHLKTLQTTLSDHIKEHGDDSVVLYSGKPPLHPEKYSRYFLKNEISKHTQALKELEKDDCFFEGTLSLSLIVGGDVLDFNNVDPKDFVPIQQVKEYPTKEGLELLSKIVETPIKFNNNVSVRLIGPPNGVHETRGKVGDVGVITDVSAYLTKDYFSGTPEGYSYMVKSPSFVGACCNELWVHESHLELIDAVQ